ncbi:unnamed protein product [Caenorhabditis brenneri]
MSGTVDEPSPVEKQINQKPRIFVLKHVFKSVSKMKETEHCIGPTEDHFGIPWYIAIWYEKEHLGIYLHCAKSENKKEWSIDTEYEIHLLQPNGSSAYKVSDFSRCFIKAEGYGRVKVMAWEKMEEEFLHNDELVVEIRVKITKTTGIEVCLRKFDDEECSDVALVVDGKKFHVSKLYLASQSSYFKSMFLGKFNESGKAEIELTGIDGYDLQKYLEMLYGEDALDDGTVEGILHLADMYDTKTLIRKCEEYLLKVSEKTLKEKLELSARYNLNELKKKCMSEIKSINDVRSKFYLDMSGTVDKLPTAENKRNQKTRSFVLKHVFKNVSKMKDTENCYSASEDHFGVPWCLGITHNKDDLGVYLFCDRSDNKTEWSIDTDFEIQILHPNGNPARKISDISYSFETTVGRGRGGIMTWERMEKKFLLNDELIVEIRVKITKMTGIEVYLRRFDDEECSDVALVVDGKSFMYIQNCTWHHSLLILSQCSLENSMNLEIPK